MNDVLKEAIHFLHTYYEENKLPINERDARIEAVTKEIEETKTYTHTFEELSYGAKLAWRNSNRCIGRLFWNQLHVFDERDTTNLEDVMNALFRHIDYATNDGKIRSTITIFPAKRPDGTEPIRLRNHQLLRYAGYDTTGDPASRTFTKFCESLGWQGAKTPFDILPLVIENEHGDCLWRNIPSSIIREVPITHPEYDFTSLQLQWYAVPIISDMILEIGGIEYTAAPFNGWYMGTEIGARNFADTDRYNQLPAVAHLLGLDTSSNRALWQDRALVELNIAVLHSYEQHGVTLVDHHTASKQFEIFEKTEEKACRHITGNWTWLIPPLSPATSHIFHRPFDNTTLKPNFFYRKKEQTGSPFHTK